MQQNLPNKTIVRSVDSERIIYGSKGEDMPQRLKIKSIDIACLAAGNDLYQRNWRWFDAEKDFPQEPWLRTADKYFPLTSHGRPIAFEQPSTESEKTSCLRKQAKLKARGVVCVIIEKGAVLEDVLMLIARGINDLDNGGGKPEKPSIGRSNGQAAVEKKPSGKPGRGKSQLQNV